MTKTADRFWIGLNQLKISAGFAWSDNTPVNFLNWDKNEPANAGGGENCVEFVGIGGIFLLKR
jgi:hypothetical protein